MDLPKVGVFLRDLRKAKKLTQEQLAEILNVSRKTISRWETGSNMPDYDLLVEMADLYQVDLREMLEGERKNEPMNEELMRLKRLITAVLALMVILASRTPVNAEQTEPLKVYYAGEHRLFREALSTYKAANGNDSLDATVFANADEMEARLSVELLSGGGPDVILLGLDGGLNYHKLAMNGAFCDLSEYISQDAFFDADKYFTPVLEASRLNGGIYAVPFSFSLPSLITSEETLDGIGASEMGSMSFAEILDVLKRRAPSLAGQDAALLTAMTRRDDFPYSLYEMAVGSLYSVNGNVRSVDEKALSNISELVRAFYDELPQLQSISKRYRNDFVNAVSRIDFLIEDYQLPVNMRYYDVYYGVGLKRTLKFIPIPDFYKAGSYRAQVMEYGVVSAQTHQAGNAYKLLRYIQDYQTEGLFIRIKTQDALEIPVRKDLAMAALEAATHQTGGRAQISGKSSVIPALQPQFAEQIAVWYSQIDEAYIPNRKIGAIFSDAMNDYYMGTASYEDCYDQLSNALWIYMNE